MNPTIRSGSPRALLLLCMAMFMLILDVAIVNVALPSVQRDLGFSSRNLQLIVTTYALAFGGFLLLGGRVADAAGRKRVFLWGLALFTLASLACGLAPSSAVILAARAVQGLGAAFVAPAALSLLTSIFAEGAARDRALGVWSAVAAGGGAAGLLLGGVLTDFVGWRWVFLVNVPVGVLVLAASWRGLPEVRAPARSSLDLAGALTVTAGLLALVYGLERGGQEGFDNPLVIALLAGAAALLTVFVALEGRVRDPLVPFEIFRIRSLTGANLASFLMSSVVVGVNYFLTVYLQRVLGLSPLETGLAFLPMTLTIMISSNLSARAVGRFGARTLLVAGLLVLALGTLSLLRIAPDASYLETVLPGLILVGLGLGPGFAVTTIAATAGVSVERLGVASGILSTTQQVGGAVGLAALAVVAGASGGQGAAALVGGFRAAFAVMIGLSLAAATAAGTLVSAKETSEVQGTVEAIP